MDDDQDADGLAADLAARLVQLVAMVLALVLLASVFGCASTPRPAPRDPLAACEAQRAATESRAIYAVIGLFGFGFAGGLVVGQMLRAPQPPPR